MDTSSAIPLTTAPVHVRGLIQQTRYTPEERIRLELDAAAAAPPPVPPAPTVESVAGECRALASHGEGLAATIEGLAATESDEVLAGKLKQLAIDLISASGTILSGTAGL